MQTDILCVIMHVVPKKKNRFDWNVVLEWENVIRIVQLIVDQSHKT